ncbi:MAG: hypothetical protein SO148_03575 [Candidatus Onthovivens sp.]|nr:hypothetical protein [Candidatus Onthovivens sp.]MDY5292198.1 hypothetical protein [Ligilactobacillus salivarius]
MASRKEISIKITYVEKKSKIKPSVSPEGEEKVKTKTQNQGVSALGSIVANESFKQAKTIIKNIGTYSLNRYFNLTEDYLSEQTMQNVTTAIEKVTSFGTTIAGAVTVGSAFGPVGIALTTTIATVGWLINDGIEKEKRWQTARLTQNNANYNREFSAIRAGLIDGSKGTLN